MIYLDAGNGKDDGRNGTIVDGWRQFLSIA